LFVCLLGCSEDPLFNQHVSTIHIMPPSCRNGAPAASTLSWCASYALWRCMLHATGLGSRGPIACSVYNWQRPRSAHVSSTVVRSMLRAGQSVRYLVPDALVEYLESERIWK
jgi:hypothetical protein